MNIQERICGAILFVLTIVMWTIAHQATFQNTRNASMFVGLASFITVATLMGRGFDAHPPGGNPR